MNGYTGVYTGETSKKEGKLEGNGVFDSDDILILGGFVDGKLNPGHKSIVINRYTQEIQVNSGSIVIRPNGTNFIFKVQYDSKGKRQSGLFKENPLLGKRTNLARACKKVTKEP